MIETLIAKIAEGGLVSALLGLALAALGKIWVELKTSWQDRIAEQKQLGSTMEATAKSNMSIAISIDNRNAAIEALGKAQEATARDTAVLSRDLDRHIQAQEQRERVERERWERVERLLQRTSP